jgi:hypothetical protein
VARVPSSSSDFGASMGIAGPIASDLSGLATYEHKGQPLSIHIEWVRSRVGNV